MATEGKGFSQPTATQGLELAEHIRKLAAHNARASLADEHQLTLFLRSWWSKVYNRPLKDPLLETYTLEELLYEFYDKVERNIAEEERVTSQEVKDEEAKEKEILDWAEEEERREAAASTAIKKAPLPAAKSVPDPTREPANVKWMEEQIRMAKAELGDSFGEDLELNFGE
jgi:hypothetical protein